MTQKTLCSCLLILFILTLGVTLRIHNLSTVTRHSPDEVIYTAQAKTVAKHGLIGIKVLAKQYNQNKKLWFFPPPTRAGYIFLLSSAMKISNHFDISVGATISTIFSILSLLILILIGLRFFNYWTTVYALLFLSTSPIAMGLARRTWQDAIVGCLGALLVYFSCEIISNPRKKIWIIPFIILGGLAILIKSSLVVFFGLCIAWILWHFIVSKKLYKHAIFFACLSGISVALFAAVLIYLMGGLSNLITVWSHMKNAMSLNPYAIQYQTGPWYLMFLNLFYLGPSYFYLLMIGLAVILFSKNMHKLHLQTKELFLASTQSNIFLGLAAITLIFTLIAGLVPHCLNIRYISVIYVPYYLIMGVLFYLILSALVKLLPVRPIFFIFFSIVLMTLIGIQGYYKFNHYFIRLGANDTSIGMLIQYF